MTGQADALPAARRRKRKNIKSQGPDTPPPRHAAATARADIGPHFRAGWRIVAGKEFADYLRAIACWH